jgi:tryptophanyl-tRNA synthetase
MTNNKKIIFSGIQPSGNLHIGNYLGAIKQWVDLQDEYACIFCVVDYHAMTVKQDPKELRRRIIEIAKIYLAAGIDARNVIIFQQSDVSAHAELAWILNTISRMSDLFRMTQFKDKAGLQTDWNDLSGEDMEKFKNTLNQINKVGVGLFAYPVLMAADILLYNTDIVPVGDDQKQHVELTRDLAKRFNHEFGETFKIPEVKIKKESARIMALDEPTKKMSKSAQNRNSRIELLDDPEQAAKKIMRSVTDTGAEIKFDMENKPGISNLLNIFSLLGEISVSELEIKYRGRGYGVFKADLAVLVKNFLKEFQNKYSAISDADVKKILEQGAEKAHALSNKTLKLVKERAGIK